MALLLATKQAEKPYYYERLDIDICSIEEMVYALYKFPVLIPENFIEKKLVLWIRDELRLESLSEKLEQYIGHDSIRGILLLFRYANFYTDAEILSFETEYRRLSKLESDRFAELMGDAFFRIGRYGKAIECYENIQKPKSRKIKEKLAYTLTAVMKFREASNLFEELFVEKNDMEYLRRLYFISCLEPSVNTIEKYRSYVPEENLSDWEAQYMGISKRIEDDKEFEEVNLLIDKDPEEFRRKSKLMLIKWKKEYRDRI